MIVPAAPLPSTRLARLLLDRRERAPNDSAHSEVETRERCELCSAPIEAEHRHLLDVSARRLMCACGACATLFPGGSAGRQQLRLIPADVRLPKDFELSDVMWAELAIPVDVAFFFFDTAAARMVALYPSAVGVTESRLSLAAWDAIVQRSPAIGRLEPDVEALLVNRMRGAREQWIVPVDMCYHLAGLIRQHWKGLGGGEEVWQQLTFFFEQLRRRAGPSSQRNGP